MNRILIITLALLSLNVFAVGSNGTQGQPTLNVGQDGSQGQPNIACVKIFNENNTEQLVCVVKHKN